MTKKYIYISIEIFNREIYGALDLSQAAISENYNVVLGDRQSLLKNINNLPKGILFYKSASIIDEIFYNAFYRLGHKLVCLDAEGLIFHNFDYFFKHRLTLTNLNKLDYYFLWGIKQREVAIKKFPKFKNKFKTTGGLNAVNWFINERLLKENKKKEKKLIFFTSFGSFNHFSNDQIKDNLEKKIYKLDKTDEKLIYDYAQYIKKLFFDYQIIIEKIANLIAPIKIFIKIHPSENPIPWKKLAEKHKNIEISEKSVEDLLSSDGIIIQSESTTGVQSEINNKRSFSYIPEEYKYSKIPLTIIKRVSNTVYDIDQFVNVIKENLIISNMSHKSEKYLVKYFNNLKQKNVSKLILTNLSKLDITTAKNIIISKNSLNLKLFYFFFFCIIKSRFVHFFKLFPDKFQSIIEEQYLVYGPPKKQFFIFLGLISEKSIFKLLIPNIFKEKVLKKIEESELYKKNKRQNLNLDFLVKNFSLLSNYKIQELDKNLILIENK